MDIICQKIAENFVILLSSWPCLEWNIFLNGIKVIIYAYPHLTIEYYDFQNDIWTFWTDKVIKTQENWKIERRKEGPVTQYFAKEPTIFFVLKVLRIISYP